MIFLFVMGILLLLICAAGLAEIMSYNKITREMNEKYYRENGSGDGC